MRDLAGLAILVPTFGVIGFVLLGLALNGENGLRDNYDLLMKYWWAYLLLAIAYLTTIILAVRAVRSRPRRIITVRQGYR